MAHQSGHQYPVRTGPFIKDIEENFPPMVQMVERPMSARLPFVAKQGIAYGQITPVPPVTTEMVISRQPASPVLMLGPRIPQPISQNVQPGANCTFEFVMVEGNHPDMAKPFTGPKGQFQAIELTHVAAPFSQEMVIGNEPSTARFPFKPKYAPSESLAPQQFDFTVEYYQGQHPDRPRLSTAQQGVQRADGQVPSIILLLYEDIWGGRLPVSPRLFTPPRIYASSYDNPAVQTDCTFEYVDTVGSYPYIRSLDISPRKTSWVQWTPDVVQQDIAMVQGVHADLPRLFLAPRIPPPDSQHTPVFQGDDSPEMWAGWTRDISHQWLPVRTGFIWLTPDVLIFDAAMTQGYQPSQPRIVLAPRIPLPLAQTTQVSAAFFPEMIAGNHPDNPRLFVYPKVGVNLTQPTPVATFSIEMVLIEGRPYRANLWLPVRIGKAQWHPEVVVPFDTAMLQGSHLDSPRLFLAPRISLPISQVSPTPVPFSPEMVIGSVPSGAPRLFIRPKVGLIVGDGELFTASSSIFGPFLAASPTFTFRVMADKDFRVLPTGDEEVNETLDN